MLICGVCCILCRHSHPYWLGKDAAISWQRPLLPRLQPEPAGHHIQPANMRFLALAKHCNRICDLNQFLSTCLSLSRVLLDQQCITPDEIDNLNMEMTLARMKR